MDQPTGRELLANLRLRHRQDASPSAFAQLVIAIFAGVVWWFTCIYYLLRTPDDNPDTWLIVVIAVPCAAITLGWHFGVNSLGRHLRRTYSRHTDRVFREHDLAIQLLLPELPERIAAAAYRGRKLLGQKAPDLGALLGERISLLLGSYPAICRALGTAPFPGGWSIVDFASGGVIIIAAALLVILDPAGRGPETNVALYAGIALLLLVSSALKLELATARSTALSGTIANSFAPESGSTSRSDGTTNAD